MFTPKLLKFGNSIDNNSMMPPTLATIATMAAITAPPSLETLMFYYVAAADRTHAPTLPCAHSSAHPPPNRRAPTSHTTITSTSTCTQHSLTPSEAPHGTSPRSGSPRGRACRYGTTSSRRPRSGASTSCPPSSLAPRSSSPPRRACRPSEQTPSRRRRFPASASPSEAWM